jgi:GcrA cell cycle regulator
MTMEWTDERTRDLTRLWQGGLSASQVARQLGDVSRSAVIGKLHRMGIAGRETPSRPRATPGHASPRPRSAPRGGRISPAPPQARRPSPTQAFEVAPTATLAGLSEHGCRWPIGEPDEAGFGFCGRTRAGRGAYCQGHSPMSTGRRVSAISARQIDRLLDRYGDSSAVRLRPTDRDADPREL